MTVLLALALISPAAALAISGTTEVTIASGSGTPPVVKCKWEQQPVAVCPALEDGDTPHLVPGFQILPPLVAGAKKMIEYYTVVTDEEDQGSVAQAFADVYHPAGSPEPYGPSVTGGISNAPYFKYEVPFTKLGHSTAEIALVQAAYDAGLITFNSAYDLADVLYELDKGTADLWKGQAEIDYEQPAGNYDVYVYAVDTNNVFSVPVYNQFTYVAVCGIEVDFTGINFGSVNLKVEKMIAGDTVWDSPGINKATVRNIGNTWTSVNVKFTDMGFGKDVDNNWNVNFDARMGSDNTYYIGGILPGVETQLVNALALSCKDELDLSIKVIKGTGTHTGTVTIGCIIRPFTYDPAKVVGISSHGDY